MIENWSMTDFSNAAGIASGVIAVGTALGILGRLVAKLKAKSKPHTEEAEASHMTTTQMTAGDHSPQVSNNSGSVNVSYNNTIHNHQPAEESRDQPESECDIPGRWNRERAIGLGIQRLEAADWRHLDLSLNLPVEHIFVEQYSLLYSARDEGMVVLFDTRTAGDDCHACAPYVSIFEFEKVAKGWNLITEDIAVFKGGAWGSSPQASVHLISGERYAVIFRDGDMHQGWCVEAATIMAKLGDTFTNLLFTITAQSDPDGNGWSSELAFKDNGGALRDLVVRRIPNEGSDNFVFLDGREELKHLVADYQDNIRPHDVFKFNGISYTYSPAIS